MRNIARESTGNLRGLFGNTSLKTGLSPAIIEKDFWVCLTLDYLFGDSPWRDNLAFKGGTSLSKAFDLIKRFSEDIDLILDWRLLGYGRDEPWNTQQDLFNEQANAKSADFLKNVFAPNLRSGLGVIAGRELDIHMDEHDPNTVVFAYPCAYTDASILREIRIESGSLAAWTPASLRAITPYAAMAYPGVFKDASTSEVDLNVVMTDDGRYVELQGTAEHNPFTEESLDALRTLARKGLKKIFSQMKLAK